MSRRPRAPLQPTLLPFLAVLVCTLGTLILLLAIVATDSRPGRGGNADVGATPPPDAAPPVDEPAFTSAAAESLIGEETFRLTELVSHRDAQTAEMEKRREMQTHLEESFRALEEKRNRLAAEIDAFSRGESPAVDAAEQLSRVEASIAELTAEIAEERDKPGRHRNRVVIVPYAGRNGTTRRPIYIECTAEAAILWPEGIAVPLEELRLAAADGFRSANPIDEALRITRLHTIQTTGDSTPPYPLLVVRPGGISTYNATRAAMSQWDDQFGYELLGDDVELATGSADPVLHRRLTEVLADASDRLERVGARVAIGRGRGGGGGGSGEGGPVGSGGADGFGLPEGSTSSQTPQGQSSGSGNGNAGSTADQLAGRGGTNRGGSQRPERQTQPRVLSAANLDRQSVTNGFRGATFSQMGGAPLPGGGGSIDDLVDQYRGGSDSSAGGSSGADGTAKTSEEKQTKRADGTLPERPGDDRIAGQSASAGGQPGGTQSSATAAASPPAGGPPPTGGGAASPQSSSPPPRVDPSQLRWALPREFAGMNGTAVVRPIGLTVRNERMELTEGGRVIETIDLSNQSIADATLHLAGRIQQRVQSWGTTLPGGRWVPRLEVTVAPHADGRFEQLERLMNGSGVEIFRRP